MFLYDFIETIKITKFKQAKVVRDIKMFSSFKKLLKKVLSNKSRFL